MLENMSASGVDAKSALRAHLRGEQGAIDQARPRECFIDSFEHSSQSRDLAIDLLRPLHLVVFEVVAPSIAHTQLPDAGEFGARLIQVQLTSLLTSISE